MRLGLRLLPAAALVAALGISLAQFRVTYAVGYRECEDIDETNLIPDADCVAIMEQFPEPTVIEVPRDGFTLNNYSYWRVTTEGAANVFDAPNGGVIRTIEPGFNFIIVRDTSVEGWYGIQDGGWMMASDLRYVPASEHRGVQILDGLQQPFGWVMFDLFPASEPGGQQDVDTGRLLLKYDRFNVFAYILDEAGIRWYMIGPDQWLEQRWVAIAKTTEQPEGASGRWLAVDLYEQTIIGYEDSTPVFASLIATGLPGSDTNEGLFEVWARAPYDSMSGAAGSPRSYALQNVPWVLYFDGDISIHGTYWHDGFGYRRSRGCVNLSISDARFVYEWTAANPLAEDGQPLTYVYVHSSGVYGQFGISQG